MKTGVCYYPEHWPAERWAEDAAHMKRIGLSHVRIGEFAWSRLEDADGALHLDWLGQAVDVLHAQGLKVVLGTPTATPPRWMIDRHPGMLALDEQLQQRGFGSRRHYCFSHEGYLAECQRIVTELATTFGKHPGIVAWQTDNEYGCHSTSISYSSAALNAFRNWCEARYDSVEALNSEWGNVFWSMEYDSFEQIGLPTGTVTESNPSHQLAFWRFSSDQIRRFNKAQVDIIRAHAPGRDVLHNFMGNFVEFDHHLVSKDLDIATWDNYPLGFLTRDSLSKADRMRYLRTGHPDGSAFHHDLYRGCCNGRLWVMEQQPGPVNWAPYNPSPLPGMVRLWGWEAFAHGAELMSYFRWRQAPFAQEQTHTGLLLSNGDEDVAALEVAELNRELQQLSPSEALSVQAEVAIVFSYSGIALQNIQSPGGASYDALTYCQQIYGACRQWGLNVDIVAPDAALEDYRLILVCNHTEDNEHFVEHLMQYRQQSDKPTVVLFPGSGSRNQEYCIPQNLPPGNFRSLIDLSIVRTESLPPEHRLAARGTAQQPAIHCGRWREHVRSPLNARRQFPDGWGFHFEHDGVHYINALPDSSTDSNSNSKGNSKGKGKGKGNENSSLVTLIGEIATEAALNIRNLGPYVRTQRIGNYRVAFNYGSDAVDLVRHLGDAFGLTGETTLLVGNRMLRQAEVAVWLVA